MKTYRIGIYEEVGGYFTVKAKSPSQAKKKVFDLVSYYGLNHPSVEESKDVGNFDVTHRDVQLV